MGIFDKAKDFLGDKPELVDGAVSKVGDIVDEKTGGQFSEQIQQGEQVVENQAENYLNSNDGQ